MHQTVLYCAVPATDPVLSVTLMSCRGARMCKLAGNEGDGGFGAAQSTCNVMHLWDGDCRNTVLGCCIDFA